MSVPEFRTAGGTYTLSSEVHAGSRERGQRKIVAFCLELHVPQLDFSDSMYDTCSFSMIKILFSKASGKGTSRGEHRAHAVSPDHKLSHGDSVELFLSITAAKVRGEQLQTWPRPM